MSTAKKKSKKSFIPNELQQFTDVNENVWRLIHELELEIGNLKHSQARAHGLFDLNIVRKGIMWNEYRIDANNLR